MKNRRIAAGMYLVFAAAAFGQGITTKSLPNGGVGVSYSAQLQASEGLTYEWTVNGLPQGVTLQSSSGSSVTISGTPTVGGSYNISATVVIGSQEAGPMTSTQQFTVGILQITTPSPLQPAATGKSYLVSFAATGTPGPYNWTNPSANLPAGLSFSQGVLSGTPTQVGQFSFTIAVLDDNANAFTSMSFLLNVQSSFVINSSPTLPPGVVGKSYLEYITATGGTGGYTFTLSSGIGGNAMPPGLTLAGSGAVSGTPSANGTYLFNVTATDATGAQAYAQITITIYPPLVITTFSPLPPASAGVAYSQAFAAIGGVAPYAFAITGSGPTGLTMSTTGVLSGTPLTAGTNTFTVQVTDSFNFGITKQFQLNVAGAAALLQVTPAQLAFSAVAGGDAPAPQDLAIFSTSGRPVNFAVQVLAGSGGQVPTWLTVKPSTGTTPGRVVVTVNQGTMTASPAPATLQVTVQGNTAQSPILVAVSLTVTTANSQLQVTPSLLRFAARTDTAATLEQAIAVSNSGGGSISFTTSIQSQSSWITGVTPSSGQTAPNAPVVLKVDVNTQGLSLGLHHDAILINSSAGSVSVPVSVFISNQGPIISVNVTGVRFLARQGVGSGVPRTVSVEDVGDSGTTVNWTASLVSGSNWLTLNSTTGTATPAAPGTLVLSPEASSSGFAPGPQYALVQIADPASLNSPQYVVAVLDVESASTPVVPELIPAGLFFVATASGSPAAQSVQVYASSAPVAFQIATTTTDGASWLNATASVSNAAATVPGKISVSVNPSGLSNGIYTGGVNVSIGSVLRTVNVTLVVVSVLPSNDRSGGTLPRAVPGCAPSHLAITENSLENNFAVPAGWPATLVVQLNDDCGNAVTTGSVVASFSNGDPPLTLTSDLTTGTYSTTWQPGAAEPQMTVNVRATAPSFPLATAQFVGAVNANASTPPGLIPNGALPIYFSLTTVAAVGGGLPPGDIASVYGTGLASVSQATPSIPLDTDFMGTFMLVGGIKAPLYSVSPGLVNVEIPFELTANAQYQLIVSANGALTLPETIDVVPSQPSIKIFPDGSNDVIAQHPDYTLVTASSPAKPGENLTIYLAGMGPTNPSVASGAITTYPPLAPATVQPTVFVDGQQVTPGYAGLAPDEIGVYQINFAVPSNARAGNLNLYIVQGGTSSNTAILQVAGQ